MKLVAFGEKVKELREKAGLTQRQLAAQIGVSKSTVALYETQERGPSSDSLVKLSKMFHVSSDYLLGIDKVKRADLSGLTEDDIEIIERLIDSMRDKNRKIRKF